MAIKVGDKVPAIKLDHGFPPGKKVDMADRTSSGKYIIMGLPGAFTPC
jgi:2-Cys peroxiredoxin 5